VELLLSAAEEEALRVYIEALDQVQLMSSAMASEKTVTASAVLSIIKLREQEIEGCESPEAEVRGEDSGSDSEDRDALVRGGEGLTKRFDIKIVNCF